MAGLFLCSILDKSFLLSSGIGGGRPHVFGDRGRFLCCMRISLSGPYKLTEPCGEPGMGWVMWAYEGETLGLATE